LGHLKKKADRETREMNEIREFTRLIVCVFRSFRVFRDALCLKAGGFDSGSV
jgi:hypothetical protein